MDNPTFRGMRWNLLSTFDKIYIVNLHGNIMKREKSPDGGKEENVFDITVGTSINIFVKTGKKQKNQLAEVFYADKYGLRQEKYDYLEANTLKSVNFCRIELKEPYFLFIPQNRDGESEYNEGFKLDDLMKLNTSGIVSMGDSIALADSKEKLEKRFEDILSNVGLLDSSSQYSMNFSLE